MRIDTDGMRAVSTDVGGAAEGLKNAGSALRGIGSAAHPSVQAGLDAVTQVVAGILESLGNSATGAGQHVAEGADFYQTTDQTLARHTAPPSDGRQLV